jgi:phage shock protein E
MNMKKYSLLVAISLIALMTGCTKAQNTAVLISPADASTLIEKDTALVILDVRTPGEFNSGTGHLKNAILIPVGELENRLQELESAKDKTILVYCRSGHRSGIATDVLIKNGFKVRDLQGGINHWKSEDLPVVIENK